MNQFGGAGDRLVAHIEGRGEPGRPSDAYVALMGATMDFYLNQLSADPNFPSFMPTCGFFQHFGSPNPDTVYRRAAIDGSGTYRLTGLRGTATQVTFMAFTAPSAAGMTSFDPFDVSDLTFDGDGRFDVLLSPTRPEGHDGDWWELDPTMASLWLRAVSDDWGNEVDPRVAILRLDSPDQKRRTAPERIEAKMAAMALTAEHTIAYGIRHLDELVDEGVINELKLIDYGANGGMPLQWYHEGTFDLEDEEALLVEATLPPGCGYFSFSLTDRMFVTLDWVHAQTSLNAKQASLDDDGVLRVVISGTDPGVRNWMDTTGYARGAVQCRWIGSTEPPQATARKVTLNALDEVLPSFMARVTSEERTAALSARSVGAQLRSLW